MCWEYEGIEGRGEKPRLLATERGLALVVGTARSIWQDLERIPSFQGVGIVAINDMILRFRGQVHHGVSLHAEEPQLWRALRSAYECDQARVETHAYRWARPGHEQPDNIWNIEGAGAGTSGLFAVMVALALGYERVVLAGVPLDGSGHFWDAPRAEPTPFGSQFVRSEWIKAKELYFRGRVRSLSGWTAEILNNEGTPEEWINGKPGRYLQPRAYRDRA